LHEVSQVRRRPQGDRAQAGPRRRLPRLQGPLARRRRARAHRQGEGFRDGRLPPRPPQGTARLVSATPRPGDPVITPALVAEHGLTPYEYEKLVAMLERPPTLTELGVISALWREHCSYKHSRPVLKTLPTQAPWVTAGPGENAGVISIGDGLAVAFKIESHNHPSAVEPYQGAATG